MGTLVADIIAGMEARLPGSRAKIAFARPQQGSVIVMGVPGQLARILTNLLENAISFAPKGSAVRISATLDQDEALLTVDDDGPGIPAAARDAVFERFHSNRPEPETFGQHSGLGLSIAKAIVEGHGGQIAVAHKPPGARGARLIVRLPAAKPLA
jgi:two-component system sensor histidine kinase ChvG